jgi:GNAT superfamily N-acetyltransferase
VQQEYVIRPATGADREAVQDLVAEMWRRDVRGRHEWLYRQNPHGEALTWVAEEAAGDRGVVAVTSVFPRRFRVGGRERKGSLGGDCYVLPRARRRGLATRLHKATFASMRALGGVGFMVGPPRPNNLAALVKAGSHETTVFRRWTRPLTGDAAVRMIARRPACRPLAVFGAAAETALRWFDRAHVGAPRVTLELLHSLPRDAGSVLDAIDRGQGDDHVVAVRDPEWVTWRYFAGPTRTQRFYGVREHGELAGFLVLEVQGGRAILVDVALPAASALLDGALDAAVREARSLGAEILDANFTPGTPVAGRLGRRAFVGRETRGFQVAFADDYDPDASDALLRSAWAFSDGDKDRDTSFLLDPPGPA